MRDFSVLKLIPSVFPVIRQSFAILRFLLPLSISIIRSIILQARMSPSLISLLSSSLFRSVVYFLVASSNWKSIWCVIICLSPSVSGLPSTIASMLTPNVSSSFVFLYSILMSLSTSTFFLSSKTMRIPSLEDSLDISVMSCVFLVSISSTTSDMNLPMPAPIMVYGISVMTSLSLSPFLAACSNSTLPRSLILPVPLS